MCYGGVADEQAGLATVQPSQSTNAIIFSGLAGIGFAGPLILLIAAVQLSVPHHLTATATAVLTSSRAVAASVFTAIFGAAVSSEMPVKLPAYTAAAAIKAGLDPQYVSQFVGDMLGGDTSALQSIPGITLTIIEAGKAAVLQANADSFRYVFIIAAPFGAAACLISWFIGDLSDVSFPKWIQAPRAHTYLPGHELPRRRAGRGASRQGEARTPQHQRLRQQGHT